jgi:hypothetical protein
VVAELLTAVSVISACSTQRSKHEEPAPVLKAEPPVTAPAAAPVATVKEELGCGDGDIFQKLCLKHKPAKLQNVRFDQIPAPYPDAASCKTYTSDFPATNAAARPCMCDKCFAYQQQCDALKGCREELKCVLDSGCTDITSCYINDGPCRDVVDKWGNTSVASTLVEFLGACSVANGCNAPH